MKNILLILSLIIGIFSTKAQINATQYKKIDSLFIDWSKPNNPGGSVGIIKNGQLIFSKAYGLASLEYNVPNTIETKFNIASISKQFTAMGIVILAQQGKLSIDDDIRKHLPDLPDFGEVVTIRNMLHHTSGLRSCHALFALAGWRPSDLRTNEDLYRFMKKQKDLNFKPGDEFGYSNTNYMLMVNIIEKITEETFSNWMNKTIFQPLGMTNTYVDGDYISVAANKATSYISNRSNKLERYVESWGYNGAGNIHSTSVDMLKWLENFNNPKAGWKTLFNTIQTVDLLNNGKENNYAFGLLTREFNGIKSIEHSGATAGFIANSVTYPKEQLSFIILSNYSRSGIPQKSNAISEILLKKNAKKKENNIIIPNKTVKLSNKILIKYEGSYWNDKEMYVRKIYLKNDTLRYQISKNREYPMVPIGNHEFQRLGGGKGIKIKFDLKGKESSMTLSYKKDSYVSKRFNAIASSKEELALYTGKYYSPELETTYTISLKGDKLTGYHSRHGEFPMKRIKKGFLESRGPLRTVKFIKNEEGNSIGILVSNGRVRNLLFEKQK